MHSLRGIAAITLCFALLAPARAFAAGAFPEDSAPAPETAHLAPWTDAGAPPPLGAHSGAKLLDENELADLSARAEKPGPEVSGGALSNEHLTYIVIALAAAVIVLIAK